MIGINLATMGVYLFQPETPHVDVVDYATNLADHCILIRTPRRA